MAAGGSDALRVVAATARPSEVRASINVVLHYFYFGIQIVFSFLDGDWTVLCRLGGPGWIVGLVPLTTPAVVGECLGSTIWLGNHMHLIGSMSPPSAVPMVWDSIG